MIYSLDSNIVCICIAGLMYYECEIFNRKLTFRVLTAYIVVICYFVILNYFILMSTLSLIFRVSRPILRSSYGAYPIVDVTRADP